MITFGTSVAINNLLALRAFYTFIFNYFLHDKPTLIERLMMPKLKAWIEKKGMDVVEELQSDEGAQSASVSLNDVSSDYFAVLYLSQNPHLTKEISSGQELFLLLAQMALEFEKVKKPRNSTVYDLKNEQGAE